MQPTPQVGCRTGWKAMKTTAQNPAGTVVDADTADVGRVLAGEVSAFEGIVRRWQGPLINMRGATAAIADEPRNWRRKHSCAPGAGWRHGGRNRVFPPGSLRWRRTSITAT